MGYSVDFVNNKKYGADDINAIRTTIMTGGVIKKGDIDCLVTLEEDGIHINPGEALFDDGCRIEITEEQILPYDGTDCYIYFDRNYYDEPNLESGSTLPENSLSLGRIVSGDITDLRNFATLKIPTMAPNKYLAKELNLDFGSNNPKQVTKSLTFEDRTDISYLLFRHKFQDYGTRILIDFTTGIAFGYSADAHISTNDSQLLLPDLDLIINYYKIGNTVYFDISAETILDLGNATVTAL